MNSDESKDQTLSNGGRHTSATPSIALLTQRLGTSPAPRMLTQSEIDLLRKCATEVAEVTREVLARKGKTSRK